MNRVCHFYQAGSCRNGDACTYYHPTVKCRSFNRNGFCPYGYHCLFWHDPANHISNNCEALRKECLFYQNGQCKYGEKCNYSHDISNIIHSGQTLKEYKAVKKKLKLLKLSEDSSVVSSTNDLSVSNLLIKGDSSDQLSQIGSLDGSLCTPLDFEVQSSTNETPLLTPSSLDLCEQPSFTETNPGTIFHRPVFERPNQPSTNIDIETATDDEIRRLQILEVDRLLKRFPQEKWTEESRIQGGRVFRVHFSSTDPNWAYDVREVTLNIQIDLMYPKKPLVITVPQEGSLPTVLVEHLNASIAAWIQNQHEFLQKNGRLGIYLRQLLQWLDRNLEELFTQGLRKFKSQLLNSHLKKSSDETDDDGTKQDSQAYDSEVYESAESSLYYSRTDESATDSLDDSSEVGEQVESPNPSETVVPTTNSTVVQEDQQKDYIVSNKSEIPATHSLRLADMRLLGSTGIYVQGQLYASMHCARCRLPFSWSFNFHGSLPHSVSSKDTVDVSLLTLHLRSLPPHKVACTRCRHPMILFFKSTVAHAFDNLVGTFHLMGCVVNDIPFGQSSCFLVCSDCQQYIKITKLVPERAIKRRCFSCHALVGFEFNRFQLETRIQSGDFATSSSVSAQKDTETARKKKAVVSCRQQKPTQYFDGFPLPLFGACEHYRKSYRWYRFPCCGLLKPCDVCHDNASGNSHEMEMATRMVCGFCSKEQPFSSTRPCRRCGKGLTGSKSAHWEGGKGCRNKLTMSRKDGKKFSQCNKSISKNKKQNNIKT